MRSAWLLKAAALAALALGSAGVLVALPDEPSPARGSGTKEDGMATPGTATTALAIPPIDAQAPKRVETATFAVG